MNINLQDTDVRENYLKHSDNKQFNIYPKDLDFAVKLIEELEGGINNERK